MKKIHFLFLIIYIFVPNYSGAFIDLKKYAECEIGIKDFANWHNIGKPLKELSFKFIAYDKEFLYWDYDQEEEIFKRGGAAAPPPLCPWRSATTAPA